MKNKPLKSLIALSFIAVLLFFLYQKEVVIEELSQTELNGDHLVSFKVTNKGVFPIYYTAYVERYPIHVTSEKNAKGNWVNNKEKLLCGSNPKEYTLSPGESINATLNSYGVPKERKYGMVFSTYMFDSYSYIWSAPVKPRYNKVKR